MSWADALVISTVAVCVTVLLIAAMAVWAYGKDKP